MSAADSPDHHEPARAEAERRGSTASAAEELPFDDDGTTALELDAARPRIALAPRLSQARAPWMRDIKVVDQNGQQRRIWIPAERALTVYLDKREIVTLMTLGAWPEALVLGWLCNQRLIDSAADLESVTVDWEVGAAAVKTRRVLDRLDEQTRQRTVTTGCGQGTVFGSFVQHLKGVHLPSPEQARIDHATLLAVLERVRNIPSVHRKAGSVHGCALFTGREMLMFVEDVGRHNAVDTIAGWMALHGIPGDDKVFYTTGRLTSEMVMKAAQMGVPIVVSRNGVTAMGHRMAEDVGITLFGRAANKHYFCYTGLNRFDPEPLGATATGAPWTG